MKDIEILGEFYDVTQQKSEYSNLSEDQYNRFLTNYLEDIKKNSIKNLLENVPSVGILYEKW